jgi:hypothetical protein
MLELHDVLTRFVDDLLVFAGLPIASRRWTLRKVPHREAS